MTKIKTKQELYGAIYGDAKSFLMQMDGVNEKLIEEHLDDYTKTRPRELNEVMEGMLKSVRNRQGMPNTITDERLAKIKDELEGFDPKEIMRKYGYLEDEAEKSIWEQMKKALSDEMKSGNGLNSHWLEEFKRSIFSVALFLSRFSDIKEYEEFIDDFQKSAYTTISLPLFMEREIHGMGFALACDFLKENGYPQYVKPDVHIKDIFHGCGLSRTKMDFDVFKSVIEFSREIDEVPYRVDKLFWLIGSGKFYMTNLRTGRRKKEFIEQIREKYGKDIERLCG